MASPTFGPEQAAAIRSARRAARRILRAASLARFNGSTLALFGALTLLGVIWGSYSSGVVGLILLVIAFNEFRGADRVRRFDPSGARLLGVNELVLAALIVAYCGWSAVSARSEVQRQIKSAGVGDQAQGLEDLVSSIATISYIGVGVLGGALTVLNAWYSSRRAGMIETFIREQPPWVVETLRATA